MNASPAPRLAFVCTVCGSEAISRDAWAEWDEARQAWVLEAMFDYAHCHGCGAQAAPQRVLLSALPDGRRAMLP